MSKSKDIGTRFETAVTRWLRENGWVHAERRALSGTNDLGDITGTPGLVWECKAGATAQGASDGLIDQWLGETERERLNARADVGVLVVQRKRVGDRPERVGRHWAVVRARDVFGVAGIAGGEPVRMHLATVAWLLRASGYGEPLPGAVVDEYDRPLTWGADGVTTARRALIGPRLHDVA